MKDCGIPLAIRDGTDEKNLQENIANLELNFAKVKKQDLKKAKIGS